MKTFTIRTSEKIENPTNLNPLIEALDDTLLCYFDVNKLDLSGDVSVIPALTLPDINAWGDASLHLRSSSTAPAQIVSDPSIKDEYKCIESRGSGYLCKNANGKAITGDFTCAFLHKFDAEAPNSSFFIMSSLGQYIYIHANLISKNFSIASSLEGGGGWTRAISEGVAFEGWALLEFEFNWTEKTINLRQNNVLLGSVSVDEAAVKFTMSRLTLWSNAGGGANSLPNSHKMIFFKLYNRLLGECERAELLSLANEYVDL